MTQFKVGDWVTINWHQDEEPNQITDIWEGDSTESVDSSSNPSSTVFFDTCACRLLEERTHWQPKEGEWCWFWNNHTNICPLLRKLEYTLNSNFYTNDEMIFTHCEPFIGQLPSLIKD